ncbi:gephyrin-like molybdotransferase Glp [Bacteroidota bacterium]
MKSMISVAEAREIVLANTPTGTAEIVQLGAAPGRVLAEPIVAREDIPSFDNSAMDGYAVTAAGLDQIPASLEIIEDIPAGRPPTKSVSDKTCARIMTGAPLPAGSDSVVPVEWTSGFLEIGETVTITRAPAIGQHVRRAGDDIKTGQLIFQPGTRILASMVGTIASLGYHTLSAARRPTVSVVATGSELIAPGEQLSEGKIRNSNGPGLAALARSAGADVMHELVARDDYHETLTALKTASAADILLVSGGVSVGSHDFVKEALDELNTTLLFWRVRQKPGKPLAFGTAAKTIVFGLPGNPVSSAVCFYQFVYPAILRLLGASTDRILRRARLTSPITKAGGLHYFIAGRSSVQDDGCLSVQRSGPQGSHVYSSVATADCIIHLDESVELPPPVGSMIDIEPLPC